MDGHVDSVAANGGAADCSAILLAGGFSTRMGRDKAELELSGRSFLALQAEKLRALGIRDILIAGRTEAYPGTRCVSDRIAHRGPLSGIHAGLLEAAHPRALVLAVDTPLVPGEWLLRLIRSHRGGITVTECGGEPEPLIGVYDRTLAETCGELLRGEKRSVKRLLELEGCTRMAFDGDPRLLMNCNTPEEYAEVRRVWMNISGSGWL